MKYYKSTNIIQSFSNTNMDDLDLDVFKIFYTENKTIIYKEIQKPTNVDYYVSFIFDQKISGKIKYELLSNFNIFYNIDLFDYIPYTLKKGVNYIQSIFYNSEGYYYIFKHLNSLSEENIDIFTSNSGFENSKMNLNNTPLDIKKDDKYTYYFVNSNFKTYFVVFCKIDSDITIRQSNIKENDVVKIRNLNEITLELQKTTEIFLISIDPTFDGSY